MIDRMKRRQTVSEYLQRENYLRSLKTDLQEEEGK